MKRLLITTIVLMSAANLSAMEGQTERRFGLGEPFSSGTQASQTALRRVENRFEAGNLTLEDVKNAIGSGARVVDWSAALGFARKMREAVLNRAEQVIAMGAAATPTAKRKRSRCVTFH